MKLNVSHRPYRNGRRTWVGYLVLNGKAVKLCSGDNLDDIRYYADREGYEGILIGPPSVTQWAKIVDNNLDKI
jgi:hypothetical protein